jgi:glutamate dehydrogenase (NADP+)
LHFSHLLLVAHSPTRLVYHPTPPPLPTRPSRVNRGIRIQYSSALGPYEGPTSFSSRINFSNCKANAFDIMFTNALSGKNLGGAYGGADFNPYNKSENEIQRFAQSYMTELSKYIGPDIDLPGMGEGCGPTEIGYLYGQYKRINQHCGQNGKGLLWGGSPGPAVHAQGMGIAYFAKKMLADKGTSLEGKRCLITGSNSTALALAEKLVELGAIPLTFSDTSGFIYEPTGFDAAKVKTVQKIKAERGARVGRYIIASTAAKFNGTLLLLSVVVN